MRATEENFCTLWMWKKSLSYNPQIMTHKRKHVEFKIKHFSSLTILPKRMKRKEKL